MAHPVNRYKGAALNESVEIEHPVSAAQNSLVLVRAPVGVDSGDLVAGERLRLARISLRPEIQVASLKTGEFKPTTDPPELQMDALHCPCFFGGGKSLKRSGERGRNRTFNLLIKSQLLCQLSYAPEPLFHRLV